jgi:hypothetical protein
VDDIQREFERMKKLGMKFTGGPTKMGPTIVVSFDVTGGNLIQLGQT